MRILNLDDNGIKSSKINRLVNGICPCDYKLYRNLEDGVEDIRASIRDNVPYDIIITDMYYPAFSGGPEEKSGEKLAGIALDEGWNIPIIVFSSQARYRIDGIYGSVRYNDKEDWETEITNMIKKIKSEREV